MELLRIVKADVSRTLRLSGELDMSNVRLLTDALARISGPGDVRVDLSGVEFIGSEGIRAFIQAAQALEGRGRLVLVAPTDAILRVLRIMRIEQVPNLVLEERTAQGDPTGAGAPATPPETIRLEELPVAATGGAGAAEPDPPPLPFIWLG